MTLTVAPDAELVAVQYLRTVPEVVALAGQRVSIDDPGGVYPLVVVTRVGGLPPDPGVDAPRLQVDCYAATKTAARQLAATVLAALLDRTLGAHPLGYVTGSRPDMGLTWLPDTDPPRPRYTFAVRLYLTSGA